MQMQADQLGVTVLRPTDQETTALGAAFLAGLAEGVWPSLDAVSERWQLDAEFAPTGGDTKLIADLLHAQWTRAVERSRHWASTMRDESRIRTHLSIAVCVRLGHGRAGRRPCGTAARSVAARGCGTGGRLDRSRR